LPRRKRVETELAELRHEVRRQAVALEQLVSLVSALEAGVRTLTPGPELLTPNAAAKALSVSRKTINRMKAAGQLRVVPFGRRWRVPRSEVLRWGTPREKARTRRLPPPPYDAQAEYEKGMRRLGGREPAIPYDAKAEADAIRRANTGRRRRP
jgi:excisionase family DNA binding protein